jgi:hypothetical protein
MIRKMIKTVNVDLIGKSLPFHEYYVIRIFIQVAKVYPINFELEFQISTGPTLHERRPQ